MRPIQLTTRYSSDRRGQRFVIIDGFPGLGAEFYPTELRALARQLNEIANDADQGASGNRQYPTKD
ncbi:hypothetical protein D3C81_1337970 [compost metagenome]